MPTFRVKTHSVSSGTVVVVVDVVVLVVEVVDVVDVVDAVVEDVVEVVELGTVVLGGAAGAQARAMVGVSTARSSTMTQVDRILFRFKGYPPRAGFGTCHQGEGS
jgi:hypothetical protein